MSVGNSTILSCPACSKVLTFTSAETNIIVCPVCWSVLYKTKEGLATKSFAVIQQSPDFIQPGTTGKWKQQSFVVLGRFRAWHDEAVYNYWTIEWENKETGLLAEGYGMYSILQPIQFDEPYRSTSLEKLKPGSTFDFRKNEEIVLEKKQPVILVEVEGELLLKNASAAFTIYDFGTASTEKITMMVYDWDNILAYEENLVTVNSLQLKNTGTGVQTGKSFICTHCSNRIEVKSFPYSQSCGCKECGSYYHYNPDGGFKKVDQAVTQEAPLIYLGAVGVIDSIEYEVVGYTQKEEQNSYFSKWREYTLYNPINGFAFLSEYDGHWTFLKETTDNPLLKNDNEKELYFKGKTFEIYNSYTYRVINARGEFPYNIFDNKLARCREFIAPPEIWIQEKDKVEGIRWFHGVHISPQDVAKKFGAATPYRIGIGAVQPGGMNKSFFYKAVVAGFILLLLAYFFSTNGNKEETLFERTFTFSDTTDRVVFITGKYVLNKRRSNIKLSMYAPVYNNWFEISATLVNAKTGKEYTLQKGVEYYYGISDGESWSEGSTRENAYFTRIPAGTYFLQLEGSRERAGVKDFSIEIIYDVPLQRNLWISIILFLLWPVGTYLRMNYVEKERWRNSAYSKFHYEY